MFNKNSLEVLQKLDSAFEDLRKQLIARLHHVVRNQLMEDGERSNDVALLSSFASNNSSSSDKNTKLKIAIVGFGNFGQSLTKTIFSQGHEVLAYSRSDYSDVARKLGVSYFSNADDLCEQHPEVILLCTSILLTVKVLKPLPFQRLKRSTLFVDVLSVKEFSNNIFLQHLPPDFDVLYTHPMFGPESGKNGWKTFLLFMTKLELRTKNQEYCDVVGFSTFFLGKDVGWLKCLVLNMIGT
ncbi:Arogenate dehydrogenase 1 [Arachis hypogaea]|nr:Arogenate dehydrogenase 1 [Arachis hypogaea]